MNKKISNRNNYLLSEIIILTGFGLLVLLFVGAAFFLFRTQPTKPTEQQKSTIEQGEDIGNELRVPADTIDWSDDELEELRRKVDASPLYKNLTDEEIEGVKHLICDDLGWDIDSINWGPRIKVEAIALQIKINRDLGFPVNYGLALIDKEVRWIAAPSGSMRKLRPHKTHHRFSWI